MKAIVAFLLMTSACLAESSHPGGSLDRWIEGKPTYSYIQPKMPVLLMQKPVTQTLRYGYPVRGGHWTFPGNSRSDLIAHLSDNRTMHGGKFSLAYLNSLSYQELLSLHDDHHEHRLKSQYIGAMQFMNTKEKREERQETRAYQRATRPRLFLFGGPVFYSNCPNGRCPR